MTDTSSHGVTNGITTLRVWGEDTKQSERCQNRRQRGRTYLFPSAAMKLPLHTW